MCFQVNFDNKHVRIILKQKTYRRLSIFYQTFIFVYTLTLLIISIFAWNNYVDLPIAYTDRFSNWRIDPIYNIYLQETCNADSEPFFNLQNGQKTYEYWSNANTTVHLCVKRLSGYNFLTKYPIYPKCEDTEELCGGVYVKNKYCAPIGQCPINSILFVNSEQLKTVDTTKYQNQLKINNDFYLVYSQLAEALPINQIEIYGTTPCIASQYSNYQTIFSQAYCENDSAYTLLNTIDEMTYASANGFSSNTADKVGVYSRTYTQYEIECREKNLVSWGNRTLKDGDSTYIVLSILMIASAIDFGVTGFIQSLYYFLQIQYQAPNNLSTNIAFLVFKIFIQYFHSTMIVLAFGLWMDIKLFMQISVDSSCTDISTSPIIDKALNEINTSWTLSFVMFLIFVSFSLLECVAFSICLDSKLKLKIEPKYRKITLTSLNQSQLTQPPDNNLYMYFKPQFVLQELSQYQENVLPQQNQQLQKQETQFEKSISLKESNAYEMQIPQSKKSSLQQQQQQEQQSQIQQQQPFIFKKKSHPPEIQLSQNDQEFPMIDYNSNQAPIQKPSIKYDIDDQIDDDMHDKQVYKVQK